MGDENLDKKDKKLTLEELKTLVNDIAEQIVMAKGFVKLGELKEMVKAELTNVVTTELRPSFDKELERLAALPGPGGLKNIYDKGDEAWKGLSMSGGYEYLAEFAKDVYLAGKAERAVGSAPPSPKYKKWIADVEAFQVQLKQGSPTMEIGDPEVGGALVPPEHATALMDKGFENSDFMSLCLPVPMLRNQIDIPFVEDFDHTSYLFGNMMAYWADEAGLKTGTKPKFGKVTLRLNKLIVMVYSTDELLEDSIISLEPFLGQKSAEVFGWKIDEAIFRGTGAGQPRGILTAGCKIAVAKEAGQAAATIIFENIVNMYSRAWPRSLKNMVWVGNLNIFPQLARMSLAVGTGGAPAYLPANGISGQPFDSLMGKRIIWSEQASTLGDEGDLVLVDFSQYLIAQKRGAGIQFAKSIHLYFNYDQTAFRYVLRLDGQPWWPKYFTPKRGSTQSPIITLAERK